MVVNKSCGLDYNYTEIEQIRNKAFELVKPFALYSICNEESKSKLGVVVNNPFTELNYLYYWIDYLTLVRNEIDRYIQLNGCIDSNQLNTIYKKYEITCILSKSICDNRLYNDIFNLFKPVFGLCENLVEWEWIDGSCEQAFESEWEWIDDFTCELYEPPYPFRLLEDFSYRLLEDNNRRYIE